MEISCLINQSLPYSATELSYLTAEEQTVMSFLEWLCFSARHKHLYIITLKDKHYFMGIQIAKIMQRETSNLYRFLRSKVELVRASSAQVRWINSLNFEFMVPTHSITFIPLQETLIYLEKCKFTLFFHSKLALTFLDYKNLKRSNKVTTPIPHCSILPYIPDVRLML